MDAKRAVLGASVVVFLGCGHAPEARLEPVVGHIEPSDPVFLAGDSAATRHCAVDSDCPTGTLCHPSGRVCFTSSPAPRLLEVVSKDDDANEHHPCRLVRIYFPFDSAYLVEEAHRSLAYDARCLKARGVRRVVVAGYADARGDREHNLALSQKRGDAARSFLQRAGLDIPIEVRAKGDADPLVKGATELSYAYNRRVEIR